MVFSHTWLKKSDERQKIFIMGEKPWTDPEGTIGFLGRSVWPSVKYVDDQKNVLAP